MEAVLIGARTIYVNALISYWGTVTLRVIYDALVVICIALISAGTEIRITDEAVSYRGSCAWRSNKPQRRNKNAQRKEFPGYS